ncbi:MAG: hypothetical protein OHK0039_00920 [Bacteroidia bacterium]
MTLDHPAQAHLPRPFTWWHALAILLVANLISAAPAGYNG